MTQAASEPLRAQLTNAIVDLVVRVPPSDEAAQTQPAVRAHAIARTAARRASLLAGSLSLPPGVLGWVTVLPEMVGVWKLQAQMVADIAAVYGQHHRLRREHLLYCLFKQISAQLFRDLAVRMGERVVVRPTTQKVLQVLAQKLGVALAGAALRKGASRFVPLLGAVSVGAYAYYDTLQVANNAVALFEDKKGL
ncbi:hypothetical protein [Rhodoferax sp.]|uniref:hypothetical protein n=1 Tax=Rhodoferax sp. TaxID=50421 RepID=UPI002ACEFDF0|nr:hypothetical protein [Rhodoferax sp.]MDZ7918685.1 hypothetical protein [Rhodoferax sp.]